MWGVVCSETGFSSTCFSRLPLPSLFVNMKKKKRLPFLLGVALRLRVWDGVMAQGSGPRVWVFGLEVPPKPSTLSRPKPEAIPLNLGEVVPKPRTSRREPKQSALKCHESRKQA